MKNKIKINYILAIIPIVMAILSIVQGVSNIFGQTGLLPIYSIFNLHFHK